VNLRLNGGESTEEAADLGISPWKTRY
jgi:hypothetical protein